MKNMIEFYYSIKIESIQNNNNTYFFNIKNNNFIFKPYYNNPNIIEDIYKLNNYIGNHISIDKIIANKYNTPITIIHNTPYILLLKRKKTNINLKDISNISNITPISIKTLERNNWEILWSNKIDYYEMQILENKKKYPLIRESFDYFVGLAENAISYLVNTKKENTPTIHDNKVISHNNLFNSIYDPSNIILDHKSRDIAEYIKISFFKNNYQIFKELDMYFRHNIYSIYGIRVLFSRILYPSFYFELYDNIINEKKEEKELNKIINKINDYEIYLYNIYLYLRKYYDIPSIEWIKKQGINPHLRL